MLIVVSFEYVFIENLLEINLEVSIQ